MTRGIAILALLCLPGSAGAWIEPSYFDAPAEDGGGGGLSFTGSDATKGLHCGHCHIAAEGRIGCALQSDPPLSEGYQSAPFFRFSIAIEGEHLGIDLACDPARDISCNQNAFAFEVTDGRGSPVGQLCTAAPQDGACTGGLDVNAALTEELHVARPRGRASGDTQWEVYWIPPTEPALDVHAWAVVVDGDGGDGTFSVAPSTLNGDDFATAHLTAGARPDGGCRAVPERRSPGVLVALLALAVLLLARRRATTWAALLGLLPACAPDPPPPRAEDESMFATQVRPLLAENCLGPACHQGTRPAGRLDLSSLEAIGRRTDAILPFGPYLDGLLLIKTIVPAQQSGLEVPADLDIDHGGFVFNNRQDDRFELLQKWIAAGAPPLHAGEPPQAATHAQPLEPACLPGADAISAEEKASFAEVEPELVRSCTGVACHSGVGGLLWFRNGDDDAGDCEGDRTVQNLLQAAQFVERGEDPTFSLLLRKLVPVSAGGVAHEEYPFFATLEEAAASPLGRWLASYVGDPLPDERTAEERFFAEEVQPILVRKGCFFQDCHGPSHFSDLRLDPGVRGAFSRSQTHANYEVARSFLQMGAFPRLSRLVRKSTATSAGGISHIALAAFRDANDPALDVLEEWVARETAAQESARGLPDGSIGVATGLLYVAAPPAAYSLREPTQELYGSRLMFAPLERDGRDVVTGAGAADDLLEDFLAGRSADIRTPAVSYDGTRAVFSMRIQGEPDRLLYEIDLATRDVQALTAPGGDCPTVDADPAFAWDDSIVFVSTRACLRTPAGPEATHLYVLGSGAAAPEQISYSPFQVYQPWIHTDGKVHYSQWRGGGEQTPIFRSLIDGYEPRDHLGNRLSPERILLGVHTTADGREILIQRTPEATVPAGEIAIFSRSFGPPTDDPFRPSSYVTTGFRSAHSLAPLPDGAVIVSRTRGSINPVGPTADEVDFGLYLDALGDEAITRGGTLVDTAGEWELWPAVVVTRAVPTSIPVPRSGPSAETGRVVFHSFLVADSLFVKNARLPLALDSRVAAVRVLAAEPRPLDVVESLAPNPLPIQRRVVEAPLEPDGSIAFDVPADTPLRYQSLDADGLALNAALWYQSIRPGALVNQNTPTRFFDGFCGGCHGPRNQPANPPVTLDVVSGASLSVAAIEGPGETTRDGQPDLLGFDEDVWSILEARCTSCHGARGGEGGLSLERDTAFETLLATHEDDGGDWRYVDSAPGLARRSYLVEVLFGRELDSSRDLPDGPHPDTELSPEELRRIALWIDLGASRSRSYR